MLVRESVTRLDFSVGGQTGDVNLDGIVDSEDLYAIELISEFVCEADMNGDGTVNSVDAELLADLIRDGETADIDSRD
ncbi:MAG: dockerin type I domain-containing protein [Phycisphaerales bacterium]